MGNLIIINTNVVPCLLYKQSSIIPVRLNINLYNHVVNDIIIYMPAGMLRSDMLLT